MWELVKTKLCKRTRLCHDEWPCVPQGHIQLLTSLERPSSMILIRALFQFVSSPNSQIKMMYTKTNIIARRVYVCVRWNNTAHRIVLRKLQEWHPKPSQTRQKVIHGKSSIGMKVRLDEGVSGVRWQKSGRARNAGRRGQEAREWTVWNGERKSGMVATAEQAHKVGCSVGFFAIRAAVKPEGMPGHMQRGQIPTFVFI